jgi:hypothetical protein
MLLWPTSAIGVWLLLDFNRQFNKASDCFSTRWEVGLAAAPVVYRPQKLLRCRSPAARLAASQISRSISSSETNHGDEVQDLSQN